MQLSSCPTTPISPRVPQRFEQSGVVYEDPFLSLETDSPQREEWIKGQNGHTRCALDASPRREAIKNRLLELFGSGETDYKSVRLPGDGFQLEWTRAKGQSSYVLHRWEGEKSTVVFDPNSWPKGQTVGAMKGSPDNRYLAYTRAINGMDVGRLEILDVKTGALVTTVDGMRVQDKPIWSGKDDKVFFSLKQGQPGFLSYDISDAKVEQKGARRLAYDGEIVERNGSLLYTSDAATYGNESLIFINPEGEQSTLPIPEGRASFASYGGNVFVKTNGQAPDGRVYRVAMDRLVNGQPLVSEVVPPVAGRNLGGVAALKDGLAVSYTENGMQGITVYGQDGKVLHQLSTSEPGVCSGLQATADGNLLFTWSTLAQPNVQKKLDVATGAVTVVAETQIPGYNPLDYQVKRKLYTSTDGTQVPISLVHKKGIELDGSNPGHIYVYGGFGTAIAPSFSADRVPFLEAGGVYAIAHVRGGGDLGEDWHNQATGLNRMKVYDDVAEAAKFMASEGYSDAKHLSVGGVSNGGLVSAVAATRNAGLFDAAVIGVGLTDMARFESLGGASWAQEYGSMKDPEQAKSLLSWSPYHNVHDNGSYPALLIHTGKTDDRVKPAHSYKFAARMQEVETPDHPVYLRVDEGQGHFSGNTNEARANTLADQWSFLLDELTDNDGPTTLQVPADIA